MPVSDFAMVVVLYVAPLAWFFSSGPEHLIGSTYHWRFRSGEVALSYRTRFRLIWFLHAPRQWLRKNNQKCRSI